MSAVRGKLTGWYRLAYPAALEGGGSRRTSVLLRNPSVTDSGKLADTVIISGQEVKGDAEATHRLQVVMAATGEYTLTRMVQDLVSERLVTPGAGVRVQPKDEEPSMIGYVRPVRVRRARAAYALAVLEAQIADNRRRLNELRSPNECPQCKAMETASE